MRKTIAVLLSAALLCTGMDAPYIFAADMQEETDPLCGKCGENVFWEYDGAGTLTISGSGEMNDYTTYQLSWNSDFIRTPWFDFSDEIVTCIIQEGITGIGESSFARFPVLKNVTIADTVTEIGKAAFYECDSLAEITLPDSIREIGEYSFEGCENLSSINIPDGITHIRRETFRACSSLKNIELPNTVTTIEWYALGGGCGIEEIRIPASLVEIGDNGLEGAPYLCSIQVDKQNPQYCSEDGILFSKDMKELIRFPRCKTESDGGKPVTQYRIPDSVTTVQKHAFAYCEDLENITIPDSVTEIGEEALSGCIKLTSIELPSELSCISHGLLFGNDKLEEIHIPESVVYIDELAIQDCPALKTIYFGGTRQQWKAIVKKRNDDLPNDEDILCRSENDSIVTIADCRWKKHNIKQENTPQAIVQKQKAQKYNPELAYTLSVLSSGAYDYTLAQYNMKLLGFGEESSSLYFNDEVYRLTWEQEAYKYFWENDKVGFGIGQTQLENGDTLVLVVIRGTFEAPKKLLDPVLVLGNEWLSDYNVVRPTIFGSGEHTGFINAEKDVMKDLERVTGGIKTEHVKYVVTGHSRGAAVANLLEKELMDKGVSGDDVFGYNFACPDVAKEPLSQFNPDGKYDNIFNICMAGDPVSVVPGMLGDGLAQINVNNLRKAGHVWSKYGRSGWFCRDWNTVFSDNGTGFSFGKHASENYVDFMQRQCSFNESKSRLAYEAGMVTDLLTPEIPIYKNRVGLAKASYEYDDKIKQQFLDHPPMIHASFHCPVDVEITDSEGNVLASVEGDAVTYHDNTDIQVTVWKDGDEKYFTVIGREDVHFNLKGTDTGEMTAVISVQPANMMQSASVAYYENVPLTAGKQMSLDIRHDTQEYTEDIVVYDEGGAQADTVAPDLAELPQIFGDLNRDDDLTVTDAVLLARLTAEDNVPDLEPNAMFLSDVDRDGLLTIADIQTLLTLLMCKMQG